MNYIRISFNIFLNLVVFISFFSLTRKTVLALYLKCCETHSVSSLFVAKLMRNLTAKIIEYITLTRYAPGRCTWRIELLQIVIIFFRSLRSIFCMFLKAGFNSQFSVVFFLNQLHLKISNWLIMKTFF